MKRQTVDNLVDAALLLEVFQTRHGEFLVNRGELQFAAATLILTSDPQMSHDDIERAAKLGVIRWASRNGVKFSNKVGNVTVLWLNRLVGEKVQLMEMLTRQGYVAPDALQNDISDLMLQLNRAKAGFTPDGFNEPSGDVQGTTEF